MNNEIWRDVVGYEGIYQVSNNGIVKSLKRPNSLGVIRKERILKPAINKRGYRFIATQDCKSKVIHRLVAEAFIGPAPTEKHIINHKNAIKTDNRVDNLEWVTQRENVIHALKLGLRVTHNGEAHHNASITNKQANEIRELYKKKNKWDCTHKKLAEKYGVSTSVIYKILKGISYKEENK